MADCASFESANEGTFAPTSARLRSGKGYSRIAQHSVPSEWEPEGDRHEAVGCRYESSEEASIGDDYDDAEWKAVLARAGWQPATRQHWMKKRPAKRTKERACWVDDLVAPGAHPFGTSAPQGGVCARVDRK